MTKLANINSSNANTLIERVIEGYRIVRLVGSGGMGAVYEAMPKGEGPRVAIKVLFSEYSHNEDDVRRFVDEAKAASRVAHPGLVKTLSHGRLDDGIAYIVMEFLDGESLRARIESLRRQGQRLSFHEVRRIAADIAGTLVAVHQAGIVHRDLKPANLILCAGVDGEAGELIKIVDFGIAKFDATSSAGGVANTTVGRFLGTALYASPEQCQMMGHVGTKADVYSLGVMLYELLAGEPPFLADQPGMVIGMHLFRQPTPLWDCVPDIPEELGQLVLDMLAKEPTRRPDMRQVLTRLMALPANPRTGFRARRHQRGFILACAAVFGLSLSLGISMAIRQRARTRSSSSAVPTGSVAVPAAVPPTPAPAATVPPKPVPSDKTPAVPVRSAQSKSVRAGSPGGRKPPPAPKPAPVVVAPQAATSSVQEPKHSTESPAPPPPKKQRSDHDDAFY